MKANASESPKMQRERMHPVTAPCYKCRVLARKYQNPGNLGFFQNYQTLNSQTPGLQQVPQVFYLENSSLSLSEISDVWTETDAFQSQTCPQPGCEALPAFHGKAIWLKYYFCGRRNGIIHWERYRTWQTGPSKNKKNISRSWYWRYCPWHSIEKN